MQRWQTIFRPALKVLSLVFFSLFSQVVQAQSFSSGPEQATLIELYTSQGCSSCPPAEEYLNTFKQNSLLWKKYIPLALHVDYWDYLGWKDRFASAENTARQRQYAKVNSQRSIYTPGFFVNGKPWRRSFYNRSPDVEKQQTGILKINLQGQKVEASFSPVASSPMFDSPVSNSGETLILNVAITGMGLKTEIEAGEREGNHTSHEFILLSRTQHKSSTLSWTLQLPRFDKKGASQLALIAWLSKQNDPGPIQAVGGYIK